MKKIDKAVLKDAANRLMFDMNEEDYDTLLEEFDIISKQLEMMGQVKGVDCETPMTFPFDVSVSFLRDDEPIKPLKNEDVLKNAHSTKDGQIKLPKVI